MEGCESPLCSVIVPLGLLLDLVELLVSQQEAHHLVEKVQLLGLLPHGVVQLFIFVQVLPVDVPQVSFQCLIFVFKFPYNLAAVFDLFV